MLFPLNLKDNKELLKSFAKTETDFTDYNMEGSAISQVNDLLSFNMQQFSFYMNMILDDLFIDDAKTANNIYKIARMLNYIPKRKSSPYLVFNISRTKQETTIIQKFTKFKIGDVALVNIDDIILDSDELIPFRLYEGEVVTEIFNATGVGFEEFFLKNRETIDDDYLRVYVDQLQLNGNFIPVEYLNANMSDFDIDRHNYYFKYTNKVSITFDDGKSFTKPNVGDKIRCVYLKTNGELFNGTSGELKYDGGNTFVENSFTIGDITQILSYGANEESLESIKLRAPLFFTTQGRAVSEPDYNILMTRFPRYDSFAGVNIWSGEKEYIDASGNLSLDTKLRDLGHAEIVALNKDYTYLTQEQKDDITLFYSKRKAMMIFNKYLEPSLIKVNINTSINFIAEIKINPDNIVTQINNYLKNLEGFKKSYQKSNIIAFIDDIPEINYMIYDASFQFSINYQGIGFFRTFNKIKSNSLTITIGSQTVYDDGFGVLKYKVDENTPTDIGTIDYDNGIIKFTQDIELLHGILDFSIEFIDENKIIVDKESFLFFNSISNTILR